MGGAYDSTNIVPKPVVTGVTALGLDHVSVLGKTLREIAWQKAGIYKVGLPFLIPVPLLNPAQQEGVPALTVEQPEEGMTVLKRVAEEKKVGSTPKPRSAFRLTSCKASSFSVVKQIPEMDEIKLGGSANEILPVTSLIPDLQALPGPINTKMQHWP